MSDAAVAEQTTTTEGNPNPPAATPPALTPQSSPTPSTPPPVTSLDQIPQHLRNQLEAEHKRGLQQQLAEAKSQLSQLETLRQQVTEILPQLPEGTEQDDIATGIRETLDSMKSEREKLEAAQKSQAEKLQLAEQQRDATRKDLEDTIITHQLAMEIGPKAVNAKAVEVLTSELKKYAKVGEDKSVVFEMDVTDENGHTSKEKISAEEAVKQLEADVKNWGFAFKATQNAGAGGELVDGVRRTNTGELDLSALTKDPKKFFELQKSNPELLEQAANAALRQ